MNAPLRHRRRADRFAQLLDEASGGRRQRRRTPLDDEVAELMTLRQRLAECQPAPDIDPDFRAGLRAMLVATAEREGIGATAEPEPPPATRTPRRAALARGPRARTAAIAGVMIGAVAFAGMSTASENAVPGDALYGVKRSTERAQLALASSDLGRGQLYLDFAQTRLKEAEALASDLERVLGDMDRDTSQGVRLLTTAATNRHDHNALDVINKFVGEQRTALNQLASRVDRTDHTRLATSLQLLDAIEKRAGDLRENLDRQCASVTGIDTLGPVPGDCIALPAPSTLQLPPLPPPPAAQSPSQASDPTHTEDTATDSTPLHRSVSPPPVNERDQPIPSLAGSEPTDDSADQPTSDDGSLLGGLNRLLGNLLGE